MITNCLAQRSLLPLNASCHAHRHPLLHLLTLAPPADSCSHLHLLRQLLFPAPTTTSSFCANRQFPHSPSIPPPTANSCTRHQFCPPPFQRPCQMKILHLRCLYTTSTKKLILMIHKDQLWSVLIDYDQPWSIMIRHDQSWSAMMNYEQQWPLMITYDHIWPVMISHDQSWSKMSKYLEHA